MKSGLPEAKAMEQPHKRPRAQARSFQRKGTVNMSSRDSAIMISSPVNITTEQSVFTILFVTAFTAEKVEK